MEGKNRDPVFDYVKHHTQSVVTENFLKYIKDECLVFNVLGFPDVKKQESGDAKKKRQKAAAQNAVLGK